MGERYILYPSTSRVNVNGEAAQTPQAIKSFSDVILMDAEQLAHAPYPCAQTSILTVPWRRWLGELFAPIVMYETIDCFRPSSETRDYSLYLETLLSAGAQRHIKPYKTNSNVPPLKILSHIMLRHGHKFCHSLEK
jgi:hypothetical protein